MNTHAYNRRGRASSNGGQLQLERPSRHMVIASILIIALLAFEIFNFDTTRYALESLIGEKSFVGMTWAAVLAVAFCAIDFAGLTRIFAPNPEANDSKEAWYLMGAWFLGATMNAVMTWWAVSLVLLNHPTLGNEILTRATLLQYVPIFVALLVWITRVLFIGSLAMAGEQLMMAYRKNQAPPPRQQRQSMRTTQARVRQQEQLEWLDDEVQPAETLIVQSNQPSNPSHAQRVQVQSVPKPLGTPKRQVQANSKTKRPVPQRKAKAQARQTRPNKSQPRRGIDVSNNYRS